MIFIKKVITFVIASLLIFNSSSLALSKTINTPYSRTNELYSKFIPEMNYPSNLSIMFGISESEVKKTVIGSKIKYDIIVNNTETDVAQVTLNGKVFLDNQVYSFETKGQVDKITIKNKTLLDGPLEGYMLIDNRKIDLTIHLQKFEDADKSFITMSLYDDRNDKNSFLSFGDKIITKDFTDKIKSKLPKKDLNNTKTLMSDYSTTSSFNFEYIVSNSSTGARTDLYKNSPYQASALQIQVYSNETAVENMYGNLHMAFAYSAQANLIASNQTFSIAETEPGDDEDSSGYGKLLDILKDGLGDFGIALGYLTDIVGSYFGSVDVTGSAYSKNITVTSSTRLNMETEAFPFFFTIDPPSIGNCVGSFKGVVKYRCYDIYDSVFYHTSQTTSKAFSTLVS